MRERLLDLAMLALRTPTAPEVWNETIDAVVQTAGAVSGTLLLADSEYRTRPEPVISRRLREAESEVHAIHMSGGDADDAPGFRALLSHPPMQLVTEFELFGVNCEADLPPSRMRSALRAAFGVAWRAGAHLNTYVNRFDILLLHMPDSVAPDCEPARTLVRELAPLFAASLRLRRVFEALQAQHRAIIALFNSLGLGVVLLTREGAIIEANALASAILDDADGIRRSGDGRLACLNETAQARLSTAISEAWRTAHRDGLEAGAVVVAPRRSGRPPYLLAVNALVDAQAEISPDFACALCFIVDPQRATPLSVEGLRLVGRLSDAETDVCARIIAGETSAEIAEARMVSLETIKTQRKSVLSKLSARDRIDLIRLAIALRVPILPS